MNRKSRIAFGPGAASLILIVVVLSMSVLGILALMSARNDARLSRRSVEVTLAVFELMNRAERRYAALDAAARENGASAGEMLSRIEKNLPEGMSLTDDTVTWDETDGVRTLSCAVRAEGDRLAWIEHRLAAETEDTWN